MNGVTQEQKTVQTNLLSYILDAQGLFLEAEDSITARLDVGLPGLLAAASANNKTSSCQQ